MTIHVDWQSLDSDGNWLVLDREAKQVRPLGDFAPFEETKHPRDPHGHWIETGSTEQTGPQRRFEELRQKYQERVMSWRGAQRQQERLEVSPDPITAAYINEHFEQDDPEHADYIREAVLSFFPEHRRDNNIKLVNDWDSSYNCYAWALGETDTWEDGDVAEDKLYAAGAQEIDRNEAESYVPKPGFVHIAEYFDEDGESTHMARQLPNGRWTSKLGGNALVKHDLQDLEGHLYGKVGKIFEIPQKQWEKARLPRSLWGDDEA